MKKKSLTSVLAAILLIAAFSCKKDLVKSSVEPLPVSAALLADSNFVSMSIAGKAAVQHTRLISQVKSKAVNGMTLTLPAKQVLDSLAVPNTGNPSYYIFNYIDGGWAIISADKRVQPILAYSEDGYFKTSPDSPFGLRNWLTINNENMQIVRKDRKMKGSETTVKLWAYLMSNKSTSTNGLNVQQLAPIDTCEDHQYTVSVGPLLQTAWNQDYPYNYYCPVGQYSGGHTPTGCVATAMAQVIYYWQYPNNYSWSSMPTGIPYQPYSVSYPLATLMADAGYSIGMVYNDNGSHPINSTSSYGFIHTFGYSSATHHNYIFQDVLSNLDNHWPVLLSADDGNEGHEWVCDGYTEYFFYTCDVNDPSQPAYVSAALLLHMNWGWGGLSNGNYTYAGWNVSNGSQTLHFNYNQEMDNNIHP